MNLTSIQHFLLAAEIAVGMAFAVPLSGQVPTVAKQRTASDAVVPFKVHVADSVLADLRSRLAKTRFPDEIPGAGWDYGANLNYIKELVTYWRDKYDWRAQERRLN